MQCANVSWKFWPGIWRTKKMKKLATNRDLLRTKMVSIREMFFGAEINGMFRFWGAEGKSRISLQLILLAAEERKTHSHFWEVVGKKFHSKLREVKWNFSPLKIKWNFSQFDVDQSRICVYVQNIRYKCLFCIGLRSIHKFRSILACWLNKKFYVAIFSFKTYHQSFDHSSMIHKFSWNYFSLKNVFLFFSLKTSKYENCPEGEILGFPSKEITIPWIKDVLKVF